MSQGHLPEDPSLEHLKGQAKRLLKSVRSGDAASRAAVVQWHPRGESALAAFKLADAQLVVARGHGFDSWPKLQAHLKVVGAHAWAPAAGAGEPPAAQLVRLACNDYGAWHPSHAERARRMLAADPSLSSADVFTAATVGDVEALRSMLALDPALARAKGGPLGWEPLLYACYSRLDSPDPQDSTLEAARLLLAQGADPNAGFLWHGNVPPFTALTGAFGGGEAGNNHPPHREWAALARLLLDAGADPNDGQTLYNRHFTPDDAHLRFLFEYGLGRDTNGPWHRLLGERLASPRAMLAEELWAAAGKNFLGRVKLLVEHGADVNARSVRDGRTPHEVAMLSGNREIAAYLAAHGARPAELDPGQAFAAACTAGDGDQARRLLGAHPGLLDAMGRAGRAALVHHAVDAGRLEGVRLLAELGFDLSAMTRNTPLHQAAWAGNLPMVRLLVELGADPHARDPVHGSTPMGWAHYNRQDAVVAFLLPFATIIEAAECRGIERVRQLLSEDPSLVDARRPDGTTLLDLAIAGGDEDLAAVLRAHGARSG